MIGRRDQRFDLPGLSSDDADRPREYIAARWKSMYKLQCLLLIPEDVFFAFVSPVSQMIDNGRREKTDGVDGVQGLRGR